jgi:hypothetical protein
MAVSTPELFGIELKHCPPGALWVFEGQTFSVTCLGENEHRSWTVTMANERREFGSGDDVEHFIVASLIQDLCKVTHNEAVKRFSMSLEHTIPNLEMILARGRHSE